MDTIENERLHNATILVVDDIEVNRRVLAHSLQSSGYTHVISANDGSQALQMTRDLKPDLVILDLMMPNMDGFSYCQAVRHDKSYDAMPIIVQTALDEIENKLKAFQLGASDYICKPVDPGELNARTKVHLIQKLLMEDLRDYRQRIRTELDAARAMQNRLMPDAAQIQMCERIFDMKIGCHFETSSALGGDCWGMRPLSGNRLAIFMYDFSGHGMTAAMNVFRMHTVMQECMDAVNDPGNFLSTLNRHLHPLLDRDQFATMFYGVIDTGANCLLYASAAVPPPILFTRADAEPVSLNGRGFPLGTVAGTVYETRYTPFTQGDLLLLYSDCLIETKNADGDYLSEKKMKEAWQSSAPNPAKVTVEALTQIFRAHNPDPISDDMTINAYWRCMNG